MSTRYAAVHAWEKVNGPGDDRPTALQIIKDEGLVNALTDKTIIITGVSSGIGIETLRAFHATGAHCFGTVRSLSKGQAVVDEILASNPNGGKIDLIEMELSSLDSVRKGATEFLEKSNGKCNILIANAGIMAVPEGRTADGWEMQFGTNYLSHFLLFQLVKNAMLSSATPEFPSRVVSVSSVGHRYSPIRFDDINFEKSGYDKWIAYGQSKSGNIHLANSITRHYASQNLYGIAIHPGGIMTNLPAALSSEELDGISSQAEFQKTVKSAEQGAATSVFVAVGKEWKTVGGLWATNCQIQEKSDGTKGLFDDEGYADWAFDEGAEETLWVKSLEWTGVENA